MGYKNFCKDFESIENYDKARADNFKGWVCHHRLETHNSDGERRSVDIAYKELIALDMYLNRPAYELIFLTTKEHNRLHGSSVERRRKLSEANKGKFKGVPKSEETRKKMSVARKGKYKGEKSPCYGKHCFNNGKINIFRYECPKGFAPGRIPRSGI